MGAALGRVARLGGSGLGMRRLCSAGRALRQRGGLPREGVGSPAPGVSKERLGVGRGAGFGGWQWWQGVVGAGELGGL